MINNKWEGRVHAGNTTYTADSHPNSTKPSQENNMNVNSYKKRYCCSLSSVNHKYFHKCVKTALCEESMKYDLAHENINWISIYIEWEERVHAGHTTYTADSHPNSTKPRQGNNMNVNGYLKTEK